ncbi:RNA polymerase sigma factor RpoD/SigA [Mucilaginibacter corticis]|uniref:RNA polymerase sigma factor RpoD/SigA n=1 Tax=Mucilaginibacter corticis TaxID=2597670 RepID=A0A556M7P6_9SPHI|nr:RNA polymerase sigma factor RpoD/SigA [Mucilaginibacter corticis]TSJ35940.1 RNA polymerase sigma factor RpoD/SigA [Mucilaginibacter corticis]
MRGIHITSSITDRGSQAVELYFNDISKTALLSGQEEVELAQKIRQGDQAALDKLVSANLRFVVSVAKKYQYQGLPLSDLINEGNLGLIKAAKRFDETRGFKFISFAVWWIRQSIVAGLLENARMIRLPSNIVADISQINRAAGAIEQETTRAPTQEQIAQLAKMSLNKVRDGLHSAAWTCSYDSVLDEDGYTLLDRLSSPDHETDKHLLAESRQQEMQSQLCRLSGKEQQVIRMTYGFNNTYEMSASEISGILGLSAERIRQIRNSALDKLKAGLVK